MFYGISLFPGVHVGDIQLETLFYFRPRPLRANFNDFSPVGFLYEPYRLCFHLINREFFFRTIVIAHDDGIGFLAVGLFKRKAFGLFLL